MNETHDKTLAIERPVRSLAEKAYVLLEEMIVTLALPPGTVVSEADLSHRLAIGRTPIREALQRLSSERLVATMPRRGVIVTEINIAEHLVLLETRRVLDRLLAVRAAKRANPEQCDLLRACALEMIAAAQDNDTETFMRRDRKCDEIVGQAARNPFAAQASAPLHAHCRRFWYVHQNNGDLTRSAALHAGLMNAVAHGDGERAARASDILMDYLDQFTKTTLDHF